MCLVIRLLLPCSGCRLAANHTKHTSQVSQTWEITLIPLSKAAAQRPTPRTDTAASRTCSNHSCSRLSDNRVPTSQPCGHGHLTRGKSNSQASKFTVRLGSEPLADGEGLADALYSQRGRSATHASRPAEFCDLLTR